MKVSIDQAVVARLHQAAGGRLREWIDDHTDQIRRIAKSKIPRAGTELGKRDVGEKIGMARKDIAAIMRGERLVELEKMGAGVAYKAVTKAAALGEFDVHAAKLAGDTAGCAYWKQELFGTVASRPADGTYVQIVVGRDPYTGASTTRNRYGVKIVGDSPEGRAAYLAGCAYLREHLPAVHTVSDLLQFLRDWRSRSGRDGSNGLGSYRARTMTPAEALAEGLFKPADPYPPGSRNYGRARMDEPVLMAIFRAGFHDGYNATVNGVPMVVLTKTLPADEAEAARKQATAMGPRFFSAMNTTDGTFHDEAKIRAQIYERRADWSWSEAGETPDGQPKTRNEFVFVRAGLTGIRTGGPDIGKVTGSQLKDTFGLRGVEHGLWMGDTDSDTGEASAYGAFLDLSIILGVPKVLMGFNGRLGLALGARGSGKAAAHYEPGRQVINMTKTKGAGTLAHEWGHAMDHWFADPTGKRGKAAYCSQGERTGEPAVDAAFAEVMRAILGPDGAATDKRRRNGDRMPGDPPDGYPTGPITSRDDRNNRVVMLNAWQREGEALLKRGMSAPRDEDMIAEAQADLDARKLALLDFQRLDKKWDASQRESLNAHRAERIQARRQITKYLRDAESLGDYWARPQELFARAWEAWVEDTLEARGWKSTYLVSGTRPMYAVVRDDTKPNVTVEVYPQGEERTAINAAMSKLVAVLVGRA